MVIIEVFDEVNFAVTVEVPEARDLVTASDINGLIDNFDAERLEQSRSDSFPGKL